MRRWHLRLTSSALNGFCAPFGVDCRFGPTPVLALGNEDLVVESVRTWEVGYRGIFAGQMLLTLDYYRTRSSNLVTSLLPQVGTVLGRLNPRFGPWQAPAGLPGEVADQIRSPGAAAVESLRRLEHPGGGVVHELRAGRQQGHRRRAQLRFLQPAGDRR